MTDVEGPLVPPERFSSLLAIRGASAAVADGNLEAGCNMAQAFENPHGRPGNGTAFLGLTPSQGHTEVPGHVFRIAVPGPACPVMPERRHEYGSVVALPQA